MNGVPRANLAALDATSGAVDPGFVADTDGTVDAVVSDGSGVYAGGVFNTVNPSVYEGRKNPVKLKAHYYAKDLQDWARFYGLKIGQPTVLVCV